MIINNYNGVVCVENIIPSIDLKKIQHNISNYCFSPSIVNYSFFANASQDSHSIIMSANLTVQKIINYFYGHQVYDEDCGTINKYLAGWKLDPHDDSGPTNSGRDTTDFASVIYFNNDFIGGNLRFISKDVLIKPKGGMAVISPATPEYLHEVTRITSGERYTATTFWQKINTHINL